MQNKNTYEGIVTESYFDEKVGCNVTVILDTSGRLSDKRKIINQKAKEKGFMDIDHYEGFLYANSLFNEMRNGYDVDILKMHNKE